jgi:hypothetical protein
MSMLLDGASTGVAAAVVHDLLGKLAATKLLVVATDADDDACDSY